MKPRVLGLTLLGGSSHLQPTCPSTSPRDGKTPLPSRLPLSTIEETEISSRPGSSSEPAVAERGLGFGLGWQKIGAKADGEVVLLPNRRANAGSVALPWTSIGWRAAVPTRVGVWGEKDSQELRVHVLCLRGFLGFAADGGQDTRPRHSRSTQEVFRLPVLCVTHSHPHRKRFSPPPHVRSLLQQLQLIFVMGVIKRRGDRAV